MDYRQVEGDLPEGVGLAWDGLTVTIEPDGGVEKQTDAEAEEPTEEGSSAGAPVVAS
jgi:hypothetical protein